MIAWGEQSRPKQYEDFTAGLRRSKMLGGQNSMACGHLTTVEVMQVTLGEVSPGPGR